MMKLNKYWIITLLLVASSSLSYTQDSTHVDTISNKASFRVSELSTFIPSPANSLKSQGCGFSCSGGKEYYIRTGYSGFNPEDATEIPNDNPDINWRLVSTPCNDDPPLFIAWTVDHPYFGTMGLTGDYTTKSIKAQGPCTGDLGEFVYETDFCLSEDATEMVMELKCIADNYVKEVRLNDVVIATKDPVVDGWTDANMIDLTVDSGDPLYADIFETGATNTLSITIVNYGYITELDQQQTHFGQMPSPSALEASVKINVHDGCITCCNKKPIVWGSKFEDLNGNSELDEGEVPLEGITMELRKVEGAGGSSLVASTTTDESGMYLFTDFLYDPTDSYFVKETIESGWTCTYPSASGESSTFTLEDYKVVNNVLFLNTETPDPGPCTDCGDSFSPIPNEKYWISAWVHVDYPEQQLTFENGLEGPFLRAIFIGTDAIIPEMYPSGEIIDGWQRIVGSFTVPSDATNFLLSIEADASNTTYFDDIRIHPFNGSMKSYVYDGETFWLVSELDDNNYATFYEYDQEGGLIRIKKETSRGIVTIQETRSNTLQVDPNP
ncbi:MAG: hypothetical protein MI810_01910 [Flavobacteriales bacterium]|nr:hypothetical protein [Flavobacteriales bacterium]